jgi:hypothetical protein
MGEGGGRCARGRGQPERRRRAMPDPGRDREHRAMRDLYKMSQHAAEQRREDAAPAVRAAHQEVESVAGLDQAGRGIAFQPADLDRDGLSEPGEGSVDRRCGARSR